MEGRDTQRDAEAARDPWGGPVRAVEATRREARGKRNQLLFARNVVRGKWRTEGWPDVMAPSTQPRLLPSGICSMSIVPLHPSLFSPYVRHTYSSTGRFRNVSTMLGEKCIDRCLGSFVQSVIECLLLFVLLGLVRFRKHLISRLKDFCE